MSIRSYPSAYLVERALTLRHKATVLGIAISKTEDDIYAMNKGDLNGFCEQIYALIHTTLIKRIFPLAELARSKGIEIPTNLGKTSISMLEEIHQKLVEAGLLPNA